MGLPPVEKPVPIISIFIHASLLKSGSVPPAMFLNIAISLACQNLLYQGFSRFCVLAKSFTNYL